MDCRQFVASLAASLAWPVTLVAAIFIIKSQLPALFPFVERLKYKDFELEFRKTVKQMSEKSPATFAADFTDDQANTQRNRLYALADMSPRSAILEAWLSVETAGADALLTQNQQLAARVRMVAPLRLGELLRQYNVIGGTQLETFRKLRELRNKAVHIGEATFRSEEVVEYVDLALGLAAEIRKGTLGT